jgi:hypothetical protein
MLATKETYRMPISEYALTQEEKVALAKFLSEHQIYCPDIKSNYSICFDHGSGIGIGVYAVCKSCGKRKDITDYNMW